MTDATLPPPHEPQDGVSLPLPPYLYGHEVSGMEKVWSENSILTLKSDAQATSDALRGELARMTERRDALHNTLHSERYRTDKHVTNLHAEIAALKAKQIDVGAVMRLAEHYAAMAVTHNLSTCNGGSGHLTLISAACADLRTALLGDGGTL